MRWSGSAEVEEIPSWHSPGDRVRSFLSRVGSVKVQLLAVGFLALL